MSVFKTHIISLRFKQYELILYKLWLNIFILDVSKSYARYLLYVHIYFSVVDPDTDPQRKNWKMDPFRIQHGPGTDTGSEIKNTKI